MRAKSNSPRDEDQCRGATATVLKCQLRHTPMTMKVSRSRKESNTGDTAHAHRDRLVPKLARKPQAKPSHALMVKFGYLTLVLVRTKQVPGRMVRGGGGVACVGARRPPTKLRPRDDSGKCFLRILAAGLRTHERLVCKRPTCQYSLVPLGGRTDNDNPKPESPKGMACSTGAHIGFPTCAVPFVAVRSCC